MNFIKIKREQKPKNWRQTVIEAVGDKAGNERSIWGQMSVATDGKRTRSEVIQWEDGRIESRIIREERRIVNRKWGSRYSLV